MKTLRVLLVSTLSGEGSGYLKHGLGMISACLKQDGHQVRILHDPAGTAAAVSSDRPHLVGIYGLSSSFREMLAAAGEAKRLAPASPVFVGGPAPTLSPHWFEREEAREVVDFIYRGEGEITFRRMVNQFAADGALPSGRVITAEVVHDLDALPFVDRSGYEGGEVPHPLFRGLPGPMFTLLNSRWCRKRCRFCAPATSTLFGGVKKLRSVDHFLAEMRTLPPDSLFMIHDDNMIENLEWAGEFLEKYRPLSRPFICQAYPAEIVRAEVLLKGLREVGLTGVLVGFESGSDRMLKVMRKGTNRSINEKAAEVLHRLGIGIQANLMFGSPGETPREMMETVEMFNRALWPAIPSPAVFTPYPGSDWYDELLRDGLITISDEHQYERHSTTRGKIRGVDYRAVRWAIFNLKDQRTLAQKARRLVKRPLFRLIG